MSKELKNQIKILEKELSIQGRVFAALVGKCVELMEKNKALKKKLSSKVINRKNTGRA